MKKLITIVAILAFVGCDKQRDLYVMSNPMLGIEGDWMPSLGRNDMTMDATVLAYPATGEYIKEYFYNPNKATLKVTRGTYDVMVFNGLMYSAEQTHLDGVYFRGIDALNTFEAVAAEGNPIKRLGSRGDAEYIATNDMEIVTSAVQRQDVNADAGYNIKYKDGKNGNTTADDYVEAELDMTPIAMSYETQIFVTVTNISSAYGASAALYGFAGSAFMAERMPSDFYVSHHLPLNDKEIIDQGNDIGKIRSPKFVTFGPPVDAASGHKYEMYFYVMLVNGEVFEETIDVTDHVEPYIALIQDNIDGVQPIKHGIQIVLNVELELPEAEPVDGGIGVEDWDEDEIIKVPIPKP